MSDDQRKTTVYNTLECLASLASAVSAAGGDSKHVMKQLTTMPVADLIDIMAANRIRFTYVGPPSPLVPGAKHAGPQGPQQDHQKTL